MGNAVRRLTSGGVTPVPADRTKKAVGTRWALPAKHRQLAFDMGAVAIAALDVWLGVSPEVQLYNWVLSIVAVTALTLRRRFPFLVLLLIIPGFLAGWAQLAAMIALGTLARRKLLSTQTFVAAGLVWLSRFMLWPPADFMELQWRQHILDAIYGCIVAGMPVAIALLAAAREELSTRIAELAASRERERMLHAHAVRADERARLARDMHDLVSHQVSLIAMQAGTLRMTAGDANAKQVAGTIRTLSTRTLDELRQLVSVLRTTGGDDSPQPGVGELPQLVAGAGLPATFAVHGPVHDVAASISGAVYRTVQEALTNIGKHAPGSATSVRVAADGDVMLVEVLNEPPTASTRVELPGGGHGLVGLRERAALLDGTFDAGPTEDGGFLVRVAFPLR